MDLLMQVRSRLALGAVLVVGCVPDLDTDESTVAAPRVLAVAAEPAEAAPGQPVQYRALVADATGTIADAAPSWFHCLAQKPLAELGPVSPACLQGDSGKLAPIGDGPTVMARLPTDACALFGPNPPPPVDDQPPGRPVDADETGGYKLPVLLGLGAQKVTLYEQRIQCGLAGVSPDVSLSYATRYHRNQNPTVQTLAVVQPDGSVHPLGQGEPLEVSVGAQLTLEVAWPACPEIDACGDGVCGPDESSQTCAADCAAGGGCGGQERYLYFDREASALTVRRESMRVAWYQTRGAYADERTGIDADAGATSSRNTWTAPDAGSVTLWVVLRDERGGVAYREQAVFVR